VIVGTMDDGRIVERPFSGRLDAVRQTRHDDLVANVSVHEAGHAIAYGVLFGLAPLQLTSRVTGSFAAGFMFPHDILDTRESLLAKIRVLLAGGIAEEAVFGVDRATAGRVADREQATVLALDFVRRYGFDEEFQANYTLELAHAMDKAATDLDTEKMLTRLVGQTRELLSQHRELLTHLSRVLRDEGSVDSAALVPLFAEHGVVIDARVEGYQHIPPFAADLTAHPRTDRG